MKIIIILVTLTMLVASTQVLDNDTIEKLKKWHQECIEKTKIDRNLVKSLKSGNWKIDNGSLKEWTLCLLNKYNLMSMEGVFKLDTALSMVPSADKNQAIDVINKCLPQVAIKPHIAAWKFVKCYNAEARRSKNKNDTMHNFTLFY